MKPINIPDLATLDKYLDETEDPLDFFISLGSARSSKSIMKQGNCYNILNEIDDSEQTLTPEELLDPSFTNIGVAMSKGSLFMYNYG